MASQNCSGTVVRTFTFSEFITAGYVQPQTLNASINPAGATWSSVQYTNGTGSLQIDTPYCKPIALVASTPQTFNLTSLTDLDGNSIDFARVREFIVFNPTATAGYDCKIYQGASNPWVQVPPSTSPGYARYGGGLYNLSDPTSTGAGNGNVVSGTNCEFTLDPGTNSFTVYLACFGGSVA